MKMIRVLFFLILPFSASAQSIVLGAVRTTYCAGQLDTMFVPYQASGTFANGNYFMARVSDANGSFDNFTLIGKSTSMNGVIPILQFSSGMRVQITSVSPFVVSDTSGAVTILEHPTPPIWDYRRASGNYYGNSQVGDPYNISPLEGSNLYSPCAGLVGDTLTFATPPWDILGSASYQFQFPSDAVRLHSFDSSATVIFTTPGYKTVTLSMSGPNICEGGSSWHFYIPSAHPTIPKNARIITASMGQITGGPSDSEVWVQTGGSFVTPFLHCTIYVEPGGFASGAPGAPHLIYHRPDSGNFSWERQAEIFVHDSDAGIAIDTFFVPGLTFDYSQVLSSGVNNAISSSLLRMHVSGDHLLAVSDVGPIDMRVVNLLGADVLVQSGVNSLDLDLTSLPAGVYFAEVQAGGAREVRRIAVVH